MGWHSCPARKASFWNTRVSCHTKLQISPCNVGVCWAIFKEAGRQMCVTCRATMFLCRRVLMMATSLLRSLRGLRLFLPRALSTSVFFTICSKTGLKLCRMFFGRSGYTIVYVEQSAAMQYVHQHHTSVCTNILALNIVRRRLRLFLLHA